MADLRTNFKDDILSTAEQGTRKFNIVDANGNVLYEGVHFEDVSNYLQVGDEYGADEINEQNEAINNLNSNKVDRSNYSTQGVIGFNGETDESILYLHSKQKTTGNAYQVHWTLDGKYQKWLKNGTEVAVLDLYHLIKEKTYTAASEYAYHRSGDTGNIQFIRSGKVVRIIIPGIVNIPSGLFTFVPVSNIPSEVRDIRSNYNIHDAVVMISETNVRQLRFQMNSDGLLCYNYGSAVTSELGNMYVEWTYMVQ